MRALSVLIASVFALTLIGCSPQGGEKDQDPYSDTLRQYSWIDVSKDAIRNRLRDPDSAEFRNVRFYSGSGTPVACGEVNAKNGFGGYTGFEKFVAAGSDSKLAFLASDLAVPSQMEEAWSTLCVSAPTDQAYTD